MTGKSCLVQFLQRKAYNNVYDYETYSKGTHTLCDVFLCSSPCFVGSSSNDGRSEQQ